MDKEKIKALRESTQAMIANLEELPSNALMSPLTHYDYISVLVLVDSLASLLDESSADRDALDEACKDEI